VNSNHQPYGAETDVTVVKCLCICLINQSVLCLMKKKKLISWQYSKRGFFYTEVLDPVGHRSSFLHKHW